MALRVDHYAELDSTNEEARRRAIAGERGPVWIRADRQDAGRGRRGREWVSQPGNLFITGLYVLDTQAGDAARLSFAAALSVADLIEELSPGLDPRLKWPNDVLIEGRKVWHLAGIGRRARRRALAGGRDWRESRPSPGRFRAPGHQPGRLRYEA